jgi:glutamyl-tRNA synthetase
VQAILDGMQWLGLEHDEGPFYQMQRMDRYKEVIQQMLASGMPTIATPAGRTRCAARRTGSAEEKPRYDGRWRPEDGKTCPTPPADAALVIRFKNPKDGVVAWDDQVKGRIEIANGELDDLIIARRRHADLQFLRLRR